jgi:primosomal protein N' (replication factor Y)
LPYAEVSVNSPVARRQLFSYAIPDSLSIDIGQAVWVPFGNRVLQGIVLELSRQPSVEQTRDIIGVIDQQPLLSTTQITLAHWLSDYYLCPLFDAIAPMLPPGFERRTLTFISATANAATYDLSTLTPPQQQIIELAQRAGKVSLKQLERLLGKKRAQATISQLVARNLVCRRYQLEPVRVKPKQELALSLAIDSNEARQIANDLRQKGANRQADVLNFLSRCPSATLTEARKSIRCQAATVRALQEKALITAIKTEVKRQPIDYKNIKATSPPELNASQQSAVGIITQSLKQNKAATFLLFGVTGSGKTEIYLQALAEAVRLGKRGIVLVPEISLTPQTIERFAGRFPGRVAVIHSHLSLGERFDQWRQIKNGDFDVVIGARSAAFAPQPDLGLIVIDEEHEWSYKQDISPRYHARSVAVKLAELAGAVVVLGSATPDVESFYHARRGDYHLLELPRRITPYDGSALPRVEVVDMKDELKAGNTSIFSRSLRLAIDQALTNKEQVILFFNRRGAATLVQCRSCGLVLQCRRCNASLNYHSAEDALVCHHCNYKIPVPQVCPGCHSRRIKFLGIGTQKLEQEAGLAFPQARLLRWDSDAVRGKHSHQQIMERFSSHQADILIGTQMVAKGLDLPQVTLVGVVSADTGLNLPDFRAGERSFQLLSQVAGRAGRGPMGGRVIIQSFCPGHYAIQAALKHDYISFYNQEIEYRRQLHNPPLSQLVRLTFSHINDNLGCQEAIKMKQTLALEIDATGADISLIGPAPAFIHRLRGRFRWQLILRGSEAAAFLSNVAIPQGWAADVDPVGL